MNEKVLGFYRKNGVLESAPHSHPIESEKEMDLSRYSILENKLVPVRLFSESVDLKTLKEKGKELIELEGTHKIEFQGDFERFSAYESGIEDLIKAIKKEAKKK